jgi:hypothetical protein
VIITSTPGHPDLAPPPLRLLGLVGFSGELLNLLIAGIREKGINRFRLVRSWSRFYETVSAEIYG